MSPSNSTGSQTGSPGSALGSPAREPLVISPGRSSGRSSTTSTNKAESSTRHRKSSRIESEIRPRSGSDASRVVCDSRSRTGSDSTSIAGDARSRIGSDPSYIVDECWRAGDSIHAEDDCLHRHHRQRTPRDNFDVDEYDEDPSYFRDYRYDELDEFSLCYCGGEIEDSVCLRCARAVPTGLDTSERSNDPLSSSADYVTRAGQTDERSGDQHTKRSIIEADKECTSHTNLDNSQNTIEISVPCSTIAQHSKTSSSANNPTKTNSKLTKVNSSGNIRSPNRETNTKSNTKTSIPTRQNTSTTSRTSHLSVNHRPPNSTTENNGSKKPKEVRPRCRRSSARARLRRSTFARSPSDLSTESGSTSGGGCSSSVVADGGLEYPCTPELLLEAHKRKHLLDPCEEWMVLELNEYECLIDSVQIVRVRNLVIYQY